jgi:hypothetical protein
MNKPLIDTLLCSAIAVSLTGCTIPDTNKLDGEGEAIVEELLTSQKSKWDASKMKNIDSRVAVKDIEKIAESYEQVLGPVKTIGPLKRKDVKVNAGLLINSPDYVAVYESDVECSKNKGTATITVIHMNSKWSILSFNLRSDAFAKVGVKDRAGAEEFVNKFSRSFCRNWKAEELKKNADARLLNQLNSNDLATKAFSTMMSNTFGSVETYNGANFKNLTMDQGEPVYLFVSESEFRTGKGLISIAVKKENGGWKVHSFHVNSGHTFNSGKASK